MAKLRIHYDGGTVDQLVDDKKAVEKAEHIALYGVWDNRTLYPADRIACIELMESDK